MKKMKEITLNTNDNITVVLDLLNQYANTITLHPNFIYRGQSNESWGLVPSLTRIALQRGLSRTETIQLEKECVNKFILHAKDLLPIQQTLPIVNGMNYDLLPWLITMQHYSAPTRKLDWTTSPLLALYFCCSSLSENDGAVWIANFSEVMAYNEQLLHPSTLNDFNKLVDKPTSPNAVVLTLAVVGNERIAAQQGRFSVCLNPLEDHKDYMDPNDSMTKIIVPSQIKRHIMEELYKMNISSRTLFPGIDGLGRSMNEYCNLWDRTSIIT
jgi:hypothetical protein